MDNLDLDAIQERCDKATKGPWRIVGMKDLPEHVDLMIVCDTNGPEAEFICNIGGPIAPVNNPEDAGKDVPDAQFIVHAREDVPVLLNEVRRLRELLKTPTPQEGA